MNLKEAERQLDYLLTFTHVYRTTEDKYLREAKCLKLQTSHILVPMDKEELIVGRVKHGVIGFSPQYGGLYTYYLNEELTVECLDIYEKEKGRTKEYREAFHFWKTENTLKKLNDRFTEKHSDLETYKKTGGLMGKDHRLGTGSTPTGRLSLTIPDLDKLVQLGIPGLREEVKRYKSNDSFTEALEITIDTIENAIEIYESQARVLLKEEPTDHLTTLLTSLSNIKNKKPATFMEGLQLYWIYAVISDLMNHGRMDVFLGDLYANDLMYGRIDEETAIAYITQLYKHYKYIGKIHDTRIVIGGKGRRNEENADKLAMVIMETSRRFKDVVPQLTLRYYRGMDEKVFEKALKVNAEGCSFPILYSDDTNIPAIMKVFNVTEEDAESYFPAGCGEYVLEGLSIGTPNSGINLLKGLELALHHGKDCYYNQVAGPDNGDVEDFKTFEDLWKAFTTQIDSEIAIAAWAQKECYNLMEENAAFLHLSLLMKDCIQRKKPIFEGGVRYLNGTTEIMGMISAVDSLIAIKKLVYEDQVMTLKELVHILDENFMGYEKQQRMMLDCPKYGNDDEYADAMALKVFNYVSLKSIEYGDIIGINKYNMVSVNNSESAVWGKYTKASACGRNDGAPMANANGASIGADKNGITALLNSMSKFDHSIHAGVINNVRFSKELFSKSYDKVKMVIRTFLENNGSQINLMVVGRDDLVNAKKNPKDYQNLIIRIGGFSARFVELDEVVQNELIARTTYEAS
jgi:pyruvate-formate lyase